MEDLYLHDLEEISLTEIVKDEYRNYQIYTLMDRATPHPSYRDTNYKPRDQREMAD